LDWSSAFLFFTEARRVEREMGASSAKRQKKAESALNNIEDIKKGDL
tara:strand:+ start:361 stop:501 length:141 start_codon:yes stop_codon:yes gene_type:complete